MLAFTGFEPVGKTFHCGPPAGAWSAYPFPASIILYKDGQGYVRFDQRKAQEYFDAVVEKMTAVVQDVVTRWEKAGIFTR